MATYPWGDERRFNSYNRFLKQRFGGRMQKLTIDAGFTCPNRDGSCGTGGCTYCLNAAFNPSYCTPRKPVHLQLEEGMLFHQHRSRNLHGYLAYFQAFSNTYGTLERLQGLYEEALSVPNVSGLIIATRPDCLNEEILDYLEELSSRTYLSLEIGIESCQNKTLQRINRGHDFECAVKAIERAHAHHLDIGTHLIFGLPGERPEQWLEETKLINSLPIHDVKFHQLQIIKGTQMEKDRMEHPQDFFPLDLETYKNFIVEYIGRLRADIIIERFASEVPAQYRASAGWNHKRYDVVLKEIEQSLEEKDSWQGKALSNL